MAYQKKKQRARRRKIIWSACLLFYTAFFLWPVLSDHITKYVPAVPALASQSQEQQQGQETTRQTQTQTNSGSGDASEYLMLVTKEQGLSADYVPDDLVSLGSSGIGSQKLQETAASAFMELEKAAAAEGCIVKVVSGYRSYSTQQKLFEGYIEKDGRSDAEQYSAPPGHSEHQLGLAADVSSPSAGYGLAQSFGKTKEGRWLAKNAHRFGFIIRYPKDAQHITGYIYEPWHIRYVGGDAALEIYRQDVTLEEYLGKF